MISDGLFVIWWYKDVSYTESYSGMQTVSTDQSVTAKLCDPFEDPVSLQLAA